MKIISAPPPPVEPKFTLELTRTELEAIVAIGGRSTRVNLNPHLEALSDLYFEGAKALREASGKEPPDFRTLFEIGSAGSIHGRAK